MVSITQIEFIVENKVDAIEAEKLGATRLELVSAISEGGLTPSYGTLKETVGSVSIPLNVVIRPYGYHYFYDENDMKVILEDINQYVSLGGDSIVFGALNKNKTINEEALQQIIKAHPDIIITFHGAIDYSVSVLESYKILCKYKDNVQYIVTAGGKEDGILGAPNLREMVKLQRKLDGPKVMPAVGLRLDNIKKVHDIVQADLYHFGQGVRTDGKYYNSFDIDKITKIKRIINS